MNIFISGGCKNGKSMYAQTLARDMAEAEDIKLYYVATMRPTDEEDLKRIKRHIQERDGWGFETVEQSENICQCLEGREKGAFLLDSVTALLSNEMFKSDGTMELDVASKVAEDLVNFAEKTGNTVFVSDFIYGDAEKYDDITETYIKGLAYIDRQLARICDRVIEVSAGNIIEYK